MTKVYPEEDEFVFISKARVNCFLSHPITALEPCGKKWKFTPLLRKEKDLK